jgi:uncharacterized protein YbaR (Trm112 family)
MSGEINSEVSDQAATTALVREAFASRPGIKADSLDGLTIMAQDWWFNLRPSNTEPLLRLNVEAEDEATLTKVTDEVLHIVRENALQARLHLPSRDLGELVNIDDWLLEILACPKCHSPLRADDEACELVCTNSECGLAYPVRDDIPVLLVSEARDPAAS